MRFLRLGADQNQETISRLLALVALPRAASAAAIATLLYLGFTRLGLSPTRAFAAAIPFLLASCGGSILNDYHDRRRDRFDKPWRAIPAGYLSARKGLQLGTLVSIGAAVSSLGADYSGAQRASFWAALAGVSFYHVVSRHAAVLKAPYVGVVSALPLVCLLESSTVPMLGPCLAAALFVCGRELLMDALDVAGDAATGLQTMAVIFGPSACAIAGFVAASLGAAAFLLSLSDSLRMVWWQIVAFSAVMPSSIIVWMTAPRLRRLVIYTLWIVLLAAMSILLAALRPLSAIDP